MFNISDLIKIAYGLDMYAKAASSPKNISDARDLERRVWIMIEKSEEAVTYNACPSSLGLHNYQALATATAGNRMDDTQTTSYKLFCAYCGDVRDVA